MRSLESYRLHLASMPAVALTCGGIRNLGGQRWLRIVQPGLQTNAEPAMPAANIHPRG